MTRLTLEKVFSAKRPEGYGSLQGFTLTDKYFVFILNRPGQNDDNRVEIHRRSDFKDITSSFNNPTYDMGHGNDATWNNKTNEVLVADSTSTRCRLVRLDANTFKKVGTLSLTDAEGKAICLTGVAYDETRGVYHGSLGRTIHSFNTDNQLVFSFIERHNQINQGFAYHDGYLYRPTFESAGASSGSTYDGIFEKNTTVIYQFGLDGSFTHGYYIDNPLYEVESMAFDEEGIPYLAFNGPSGYYSVYKITNVNHLKTLHQSYTISYFDNGGTGSPNEQTAYVGIEKTLSKTIPTRTNYTFLGWSTDQNATKASYAPGSKYLKAYGESNANIKLYAVWQVNNYTITYNANGGSGAPVAQVVPATQDATISNTKPARTNYTFLGWSTNKGATAATYSAGATYTARKTATLYAVWRSNRYTITYNANGGTNAPAAQSATVGQPTTLSAIKPTRQGHTFLGWSTSASATAAQYAAGAKYTGKANVTLFAVWRENKPPVVETVTITYNANGGSGAPAATTAEVGRATISNTKPTRTNYTFLGWSKKKAATTAEYRPGDVYEGNTSLTLYAVWKQKIVTVTYDANGGTGAPAKQSIAVGGKISIPTSIPIRSDYVFLGWSIKKDAKEAEHLPGSTLLAVNDYVFYAVWGREARTITFDANGGSGAPLAISTDVDEIVLPQARPVRKGYTFLGWATSKKGEAAYQPGDIIKNVDSLTLYAVWREDNPKPITGTPGNVTSDVNDDAINDASAVNDGEEDNTLVPTLEDASLLPNSGPIEIAVIFIAISCIACVLVYWLISRRQLKKLQRDVRGQQFGGGKS